MTNREYFQAVLDAHISEELDEASRSLIQKLDEKNEKRKNTQTKEQKEAAERRAAVEKYFNDNKGAKLTRDEIAAALDITPAQVTAVVTRTDLPITKAEIKVDKKRKTVYCLPAETEEE